MVNMSTITSHPQNYAMVQITIVAYSHVDRVGSKTVEAASEEQREEWIRVDKSLDNEDHDPDYIVGKVKSGYYRNNRRNENCLCPGWRQLSHGNVGPLAQG